MPRRLIAGVLGLAAFSLAYASLPARAQESSGQPSAATLAFEKHLQDIDTSQGTEAAIDLIGRTVSDADVDPEKLMGTTRFLSARDTDSADPRYGLTLAVIEAKLANTFARNPEHAQQAAMFQTQSVIRYLGDSLILREDIARCADQTAGQAALHGWQGLTDDMVAMYRQFPADAKEKMREAIDAYDTRKASRPAAAWVCRDGTNTMPNMGADASAPAADAQSAQPQPAASPFVDDATWNARRKAIRDKLIATLDK
ncbi:MAG: hypothetical protein H6865_05620 [Rhodospirillales bacterium]|nr:hypothetical protein [Alphaproteobacteria bacterium]MCB9987099.1 hypothetical protein [Rhodospirillales bacterium]USO08141.1 MAG: hypothetical protein H6866_02675 [Rhodospirillales bacterium]